MINKSIGLLLILASCVGNRSSGINKSPKNSLSYKVYKIDSINSYYLIYASKNDSLFKIVSKKQYTDKGDLLVIKGYYLFDLQSIWNMPILIGDINVAPGQTPHVSCMGFDDSTNICIERDSINDLFRAKNVIGLKFVDNRK